MKTFRATVWLMKDENTIRKAIIESDEASMENFMEFCYRQMMLDHKPEDGWDIDFGPISEKGANTKRV